MNKKVKAMPQLMEEDEQNTSIEYYKTVSLGEQAYREYFPYEDTKFAFRVGVHKVYVKRNYTDYAFFCFDRDLPKYSRQIIFNSTLHRIEPRNNMYRNTGFCQALIIKEDKMSDTHNFSILFLLNLLKYGYIDTFLASDMLQSTFGVRMWEKLLYECVKQGYLCFYGLSTPGVIPKFAVLLTKPEDSKYYRKYIVGKSTGYRARTAVIMQKNTDIKNVLYDDRMCYITCEKAEKEGFLDEPNDLNPMELGLFGKV